MATLTDSAKAILDGPNFATIATVQGDGQPQLSVVWVERDDEDVLVSTTSNRQKYRNLMRDPRVSLLAYPAEAPYTYVEVRGTATVTEEGGRQLIDRLCHRYTGATRYTGDDGTDNVRVVVRITPDRVISR